MMNRRSRGSENGRSELDILKGRWAVRRDGMAMDKGDTRCGDAWPVFEGLGSILKGEYERRRSMVTAGERERERDYPVAPSPSTSTTTSTLPHESLPWRHAVAACKTPDNELGFGQGSKISRGPASLYPAARKLCPDAVPSQHVKPITTAPPTRFASPDASPPTPPAPDHAIPTASRHNHAGAPLTSPVATSPQHCAQKLATANPCEASKPAARASLPAPTPPQHEAPRATSRPRPRHRHTTLTTGLAAPLPVVLV
ncbi:hypothetical protein EDB89DRAFT_2247537 [Lactarius sanguifluus]|nr:hypothetical protein EDB89DRAFT_2247537 [Lactarius sanguifluus]